MVIIKQVNSTNNYTVIVVNDKPQTFTGELNIKWIMTSGELLEEFNI